MKTYFPESSTSTQTWLEFRAVLAPIGGLEALPMVIDAICAMQGAEGPAPEFMDWLKDCAAAGIPMSAEFRVGVVSWTWRVAA